MALHGIDISKFQTALDLNVVPCDFVIVGTSDGRVVNPVHAPQLRDAKKYGKLRGVYHDFRNDPTPEARFWAELTKEFQDGETVFFLDAETAHPDLPELCLQFAAEFYRLTGIAVAIYTYHHLLSAYGWDEARAKHALWGAWYPLSPGRIDGYNPPKRATAPHWGEAMSAWQYTDNGRLPGWDGPLDLNIFYGTKTDWLKLAKKEGTMGNNIWPVPAWTGINQLFGADPASPYNPWGGHTGTDFGTPMGTPVMAVADGTVLHADWFRGGYWDNPWLIVPTFAGITVVIQHEGFVTISAHLGSTHLNNGDRVRQGDVIGLSGNTKSEAGETFGPHLHFEVLPDVFNYQNGTYGRVDPALYCTTYWGTATQTIINPTQTGSTTPLEEGFLMTLSDTDQQELLTNLRKLVHGQVALTEAVAKLDTRVALVEDRAKKYIDSPISKVPGKVLAESFEKKGTEQTGTSTVGTELAYLAGNFKVVSNKIDAMRAGK